MDWIEQQLAHAQPPSLIVHFGAGLCGELPHYVRYCSGRIVLVEPNPEILPELKNKASRHSNVEVWPLAVASESGRRTLRLYNYGDLSSLNQPTGLNELMPGLHQTGQAVVGIMAVNELIDQLNLDGEETKWLIVDAPGEESSIIDSLKSHKKIHHFDHIILQGGAESLYEDAVPVENLVSELHESGYRVEGAIDDYDPDRPRYSLRLNPEVLECQRLRRENGKHQKTQADTERHFKEAQEAAKAEMEKLAQQRDAMAKQLEEQKRHAEKVAKEHQAELDQHQKTQAGLERQLKEAQETAKADSARLTEELKKQKEAAHKAEEQVDSIRSERDEFKSRVAEQASQIMSKDAACNDADSALEKAKNELRLLKQQLESEKKQHNQVADLRRKVEKLFDQQQEFIRGTTNALGQHVTRSAVNNVRQVEALIGVQRYLDSGEVPLRLADTGMDPDMAGYLVQRLQAHNYDLVIEFGAGPSTLLLARALVAQIVRVSEGIKNQKALRGPTESSERQQYMRPSGNELPRRMITLEHDRVKFHGLQQELQQEGLDDVVEMVHAPLVELGQEEERILFYDCRQNLEEIARIYNGRVARILVVVDGPTTQSSDSGRTQALPVLLQYLARHQIDIVLNDQNRSGEEQLAERWRELLEKRDVDFQQHDIEIQRSGLLISINQ